MRIYGDFRDINENLISVEITSNKGDEEIEIGSGNLFFGDPPVIIKQTVDDTFETIIRKSATINFVTKSYLGEQLFSYNARDIQIKITKGDECLFWGFVDPNTFNQPFICLDEFSITALDFLSTLQYFNYKNTTVNTYDTRKAVADNVSFKDILDGILPAGKNVYYDLSKGLTSSRLRYIFQDLGVNELVMFDDDADSIWTQEEVLHNLLLYLNLHIIQEGEDFYIFDWNSIKNKNTNWFNLTNNSTTTIPVNTVSINRETFAKRDTNLTIGDVYNQISINCDLNSLDTVIESPLDNNSLSSLYSGKQLYMTEYISEGSGDHANNAFNQLVKGQNTNYENCKTTNWFVQVMTNPKWKLNAGNGVIEDLYEKDSQGNYINQWKIPKYLRDNTCTPALLRFGSYDKAGGEVKDNSPVSKIDMKDYLFISVNGNEDDTESGHLPADSTLQSKSPIIEYEGNGGALSPTDDETINYLVFSGKMLLQPIQYESGQEYSNRNNNYGIILANGADKTEGSHANVPRYDKGGLFVPNNLVSSDQNEEGRYYTRKFYNITKPSDESESYMIANSLQPWTQDKSAHGYQFNYTEDWDSSDKYSKLPILECELIIGNKRLIEKDMDEYGNSTFEWVEIGNEPTVTVDGTTYKLTTFSLGVNPKIGDYIIGDEFDIQNTIKYQMNIDAEGTAIPIKKSDRLTGKLQFKILGTINSLWNDIVRRHPSFWRHTKWTDKSKFVLSHTENIVIQDFQCKVYSDNGLYENTGDSELVYMSAETDNYINKKDDIQFRFITQLTSSECVEKGILSTINLNSVLSTADNFPISSIYNATTKETAKAEEHYINQYYLVFSVPKVLMETTIHLEGVKWNDIYTWPTFDNRSFFITSVEKDLRYNRVTIGFKEI